MCSYITTSVPISGSARGRTGWFPATRATVYFDHPYATAAEHTLNIDVTGEGGAEQRVALELTEDAARRLAAAIMEALPAPG